MRIRAWLGVRLGLGVGLGLGLGSGLGLGIAVPVHGVGVRLADGHGDRVGGELDELALERLAAVLLPCHHHRVADLELVTPVRPLALRSQRRHGVTTEAEAEQQAVIVAAGGPVAQPGQAEPFTLEPSDGPALDTLRDAPAGSRIVWPARLKVGDGSARARRRGPRHLSSSAHSRSSNLRQWSWYCRMRSGEASSASSKER